MIQPFETYHPPQEEERICAKCKLYEPLSKDEGICTLTGDLVCRTAGCDAPEDCNTLKARLLKDSRE